MKQDARERTVWASVCVASVVEGGWVGRAEPKNSRAFRGWKVTWRIVPEEFRKSVNKHLQRAYCQLIMKNKNIFSCVTPSIGL